MLTIYKYPLDVTDRQTVMLPEGAEILCVQLQYSLPTLWAKVDTKNRAEHMRFIEIFGTGHPMPELQPMKTRVYIGTFQTSIPDSATVLVFHVFELRDLESVR